MVRGINQRIFLPAQSGLHDGPDRQTVAITFHYLQNFTVSLFGKNLTDETYLMSFLDVGANVVAAGPNDSTPIYAPGSWSFGTPNRPRYFGVEVKLKF